MAAHQDADELFDAHLGVLNAAVSFSERLRRARQLDAFLESFADAEDSGDEEWGGASLPRGTVAVAAARAQPSLANQPFSMERGVIGVAGCGGPAAAPITPATGWPTETLQGSGCRRRTGHPSARLRCRRPHRDQAPCGRTLLH